MVANGPEGTTFDLMFLTVSKKSLKAAINTKLGRFSCLSRELRDEIYDHVLVGVGTLFIGVSAHASEAYACLDLLGTEWDVKLQQRIHPMPLLSVSRVIRQEFIVAMAHHQQTCYFIMQYQMALLHKEVIAYWSCFTNVFIDAVCDALKWAIGQGIVVKDLSFSRGSLPEVVWTFEQIKKSTKTLTLSLKLDHGYRSPLRAYDMEIRQSPTVKVVLHLYQFKPSHIINSPCAMLLHQVGNMADNNSQCYRIEDAAGQTQEHLNTPGDVLLLKMKEMIARVKDDTIDVADSLEGRKDRGVCDLFSWMEDTRMRQEGEMMDRT